MKTHSPELIKVVDHLNERNAEIQLSQKPGAEEILEELEIK